MNRLLGYNHMCDVWSYEDKGKVRYWITVGETTYICDTFKRMLRLFVILASLINDGLIKEL